MVCLSLRFSQIVAFLLLIPLILLTGRKASAQHTNEQIYRQLLQQFHTEHPATYKTIKGRYFSDYLPDIAIDSNRTEILNLEGFSIQYNPLGKKSYLRSIEIPVSVQGKMLKQEVLTHQDTLNARQLRSVIKKSAEPFKGEDPTQYSRWIQPAALVGGSILAIIGLFFIRST